MECNKEEAIRAKEIAEKKMQSGDFEGALRIALKAKKLYPDLDNISQVLMVCEVHCSAQNKLNGSEMDWYGILQIEKFSDEPIVKKQFRKLALSLHPDKNKFAGAEAAFKLIGEANRVLTDPTKRSSYDMKCRVALRSVAPKSASDQSNKNSYVKKQHGFSESDTMPKVGKSADVCGSSKPKEAKAGNASGIGGGSKPQEKVNGHVEVGKGGAPNSRPSDGYQPRRSSRQKQHISYEENLSNDDFVDPPPKRSRGSRSSGVADGEIKEASAGSGMPRGDISAGFATYALNRNNKEVNQKATSSLEERSSNKKRKTGDFEAKGDEASMSEKADGMPRFYARVKKVLTPGFKLQITWLEASPDNDAEQLWCEEGLPSACGMEKHGLFKDWDIKWSSEPDKHRPPYQFEFVEILTNFTEDLGIGVSYLDKVKGFVSIYQQANCNGVPSFYIRPSELYRFSHRIPSCRMTGQEGGVLAGSFELDTAALPSYLYNLVDLGDVKVGKEKLDAEAIGSHSKSSEHEVQPIKGSEKVCTPKNLKSGPQMGISALSISSGESTGTCKDDDQIDVDQRAKNEDCNKVARHGRLTQPEGISTSFQATEKSGSPKKREKFVSYALTPRRSPRDLSNRVDASQSTTEVAGKHTATNKDERQGNQIWAMHSNKDGIPRNYGQVKKIEFAIGGFKLHVAMLEAYTIRKDVQTACGTFKVKNKPVVLPVTAFSHQVKAKSIGKNRYEIYPRQGEIWAIYKIWNSDLMFSDQDAGECDIVEVVKDDENGVKVVVLMPVNGSESFYMAPRRLKSGIINITRAEFGRFSHQCLASQAMGKKDDSLRGYFELAPSSIPGTVVLVD
ncbi:hypothetical protein GH714_003318 [Hevea brasiliensis]|uniref:J domain-containing protein n=1 Tax=Hevea brasiliensis TaxID=3981 RepID=A0A6A6KGA5_HEVBR|nr:hypothetical protein GH714_003318 [Hevea brasiliensis]